MPSSDPGIVRSLERVLSDDGYVLVCAVDHLADFDDLLRGPTDADSVAAAKARVVEAVVGDASAVLLDPAKSLGHLILSGDLPARTGLIVGIEEENYAFPHGPRASILRPDWSAAKAKATGVDLLKFLWFYRPDLDQDVARAQRETLATVSAAARAASIPLVVEPIWFPVDGEDPSSPEWRSNRAEGIVRSAIEAENIGLDMLKLEFPGDVDTEESRELARARCAQLDAAVTAPWVILSAGVTFADFEVQLEIACEAGAIGFMAGRSLWKDAVTTGDVSSVTSRMRRLNDIVRAHASPFHATRPLAEISLPETWYAHSGG